MGGHEGIWASVPFWHSCAHVHCDSDASQVKLETQLYKLKARGICSHDPGSTGPL